MEVYTVVYIDGETDEMKELLVPAATRREAARDAEQFLAVGDTVLQVV